MAQRAQCYDRTGHGKIMLLVSRTNDELKFGILALQFIDLKTCAAPRRFVKLVPAVKEQNEPAALCQKLNLSQRHVAEACLPREVKEKRVAADRPFSEQDDGCDRVSS